MTRERKNVNTVLKEAEVAPLPEARYGAEILNLMNPKSVWNLVDLAFQNALKNVPEYFHKMEEKDLTRLHRPHNVVNMIRIQFWTEYDRAHAENLMNMDMTKVWAGSCTREYWYMVVLKNPVWVGWISRPPMSYARRLEEALFKGYERLREILECDPIDPLTGKLVPTVAKIQMQIVQMLEDRKHGSVLQRTANKSVVFHADAHKTLAEFSAMRDMDDLTNKTRALEQELKELGVQKEQSIAATFERLRDPEARADRGFDPLPPRRGGSKVSTDE